MYITEIFVESFGCISNESYSFSNGVNLLYGPNESGKTTVLDFIYFLFYGFKGKNNRDNSFFKNKYITSDNNFVGGRATFLSQGLEYVLRRIYSEKNSELSLFCTTTGEEIKDSQIISSPGEYFFGVSQSAFLKTAYFSSLSAKISADSTDEIITKLRNLFESGNIDMSHKKISDGLAEQISSLESSRRKNAEIPLIEAKIKHLKDKIFKCNSYNQNLILEKSKANEMKDEIASLEEEIKQCVSQRDSIVMDYSAEVEGKKHNISLLFLITIFIISVILLFINTVSAMVMGMIFLLTARVVSIKVHKERRRGIDNRQRKLFTLKEFDDKIDMLRVKKSKVELSYAVVSEKINNSLNESTDELQEQLISLEKHHRLLKRRLLAFKLALECVDKAYEDMKVLFSPQLSGRAGDILEVLSGGKYSKVLVSDSFVIKVLTAKGYMDASCLSTGALELTYISLRFALVDLILSQKNTPLFLDDAFAFFDSEHLGNVCKYIKNISNTKQVFVSTCREEEYQNLKNISNILNFQIGKGWYYDSNKRL